MDVDAFSNSVITVKPTLEFTREIMDLPLLVRHKMNEILVAL